MWDFVKRKINETKNKNDKKIDYQNNISQTECIAESFNKFFSSISSKLAKEIKKPKIKYKLPEANTSTIFIDPTNCDEILKLISEMKETAGGIDGINTKVLKTLSNYIIIPLEHIVNLCIEKSIWSKQLKIAEVVPIFKTGDKYLAINYRPI